jgi:hypothetical protein
VQYNSAFFELFLHELLLRLGCRITIHPVPSNTTAKRPDFLVECGSCEPFYLEAVVATDTSEKEMAAIARMNEVYDTLGRMKSPNFFIGMKLEGAPLTPPSGAKIRRFLENRLSSLDPDRLANLPPWHYEHEGWNIDFSPIPKSKSTRGRAGIRPIGFQFHGVHIIDSWSAIKNAVVKKAGRYGDLDLAYVVAVNAVCEHVDDIDVTQALFGQEQLVVSFTNQGKIKEETRAPNGAWISATGPRYTRVSAVLSLYGLFPWSVPRANVCLYHNPWAQRPYACSLTCLPQAVVEGNYIKRKVGDSLEATLGLPPTWPEE